MKWAMRLAAWLYPERWRKRYGDEFEALIEDAGAGWRSLGDVLKGAIRMQFTHWGFGRIMLVSAIAGAVIAAAASFAVPDRWESLAVIQIEGSDPLIALQRMLVEIESRNSLTTMINRLSLYPAERSRKPIEDVIEEMKEKIQVRQLSNRIGPTTAFAVRFEDEDRYRAKHVTFDLIRQLRDENARAGSKLTLELVDPPTLPQRPLGPNRPMLTLSGLLAGLTGGFVIVIAIRTRRKSHGICPTCGHPITATT